MHLSSFPRNMPQEYLACCMVPLLTQYRVSYRGGTGISPHPEIYDVAVASTGIEHYNTITKYSIIIGLVVIAESGS